MLANHNDEVGRGIFDAEIGGASGKTRWQCDHRVVETYA